MLIHGDGLKWLELGRQYQTIFADPPDNIGLKYGEYEDKWGDLDYIDWLMQLLDLMCTHSVVSWLSINHKWLPWLLMEAQNKTTQYNKTLKLILWRFTFGQHNKKDFGNGYRPIIRLSDAGWYPDVSRTRIRSRRQELGDKRANQLGRVPDDVWDFARVVGNARERREWHPTQHPEALLERILLCSGGPVCDPFAGTGTTLRVATRLGMHCDTVEKDMNYCEKIAQENGLKEIHGNWYNTVCEV